MSMSLMPVGGPKGIVVHHSASSDGTTLDMGTIRKIHIQENGWEDIGYHFLIEKVGDSVVVVPGRSLMYTGAHCPGANDHIGICVVGNFSTAEPPGAKMDKLFNLIKGLIFIYGFSIDRIAKHSDYKATECPGKLFPWESLMKRVQWFYKNCRGYI
jgi:N-acetylmuramoyl-L-alanine amidase